MPHIQFQLFINSFISWNIFLQNDHQYFIFSKIKQNSVYFYFDTGQKYREMPIYGFHGEVWIWTLNWGKCYIEVIYHRHCWFGITEIELYMRENLSSRNIKYGFHCISIKYQHNTEAHGRAQRTAATCSNIKVRSPVVYLWALGEKI